MNDDCRVMRICDDELVIQERGNPEAWLQSSDIVEVRQ